jgi:hypothetical protein
MMDTAVIKYLNEQFNTALTQEHSTEQLQSLLAQKINFLVENDFTKLVQILYRIDVPEQKLKILLKENTNTDAGKIIASLIIERQLEKIKYRELFNKNTPDEDEEEKW